MKKDRFKVLVFKIIKSRAKSANDIEYSLTHLFDIASKILQL